MTCYDICSLHRGEKGFSYFHKEWCKYANFDCGICATTFFTSSEAAEIEKTIQDHKEETN